MKYIKAVGLTAAAAVALMAFAGASVASASMGVLCKNNTTPEMCSEPYGAGTVIKLDGADIKFSNPTFGTITTCGEVILEGEVENTGSTTETAKGPKTSVRFSQCTCALNTIKTGEWSIEHIPGTANGYFYSAGTEVTLEGCLGLHCIYGPGATPIKLGEVISGNPAKFNEKATIAHIGGRSGAFCPSTGEWSGAYTINKPSPLYVSTGDTSS